VQNSCKTGATKQSCGVGNERDRERSLEKETLMIKELAFVVYSVRDVPRATAFYRDVVGLKPGELFNDEFVEFDVGNATFAIDGAGEGVGLLPGQSNGVAFEVDEIHGMRQRLLDAGADVTEVYEFPPCWMCFAKDPEGNRFSIHQRRAG
jgi:predicted enzyme related to lactoylglutathione lyase